MWCFYFLLLDYSLRLLKFEDLSLLGLSHLDVELHCAAEVIIWIQTGQTRLNHMDFIHVSIHESISIFITLSSVHLLENLSPNFPLWQNLFLSPPSHPVFHLFPIFSLHHFLLLPIFSPSVLPLPLPISSFTSFNIFYSFPDTSFIQHNQEKSCEPGVWQPGRDNECERRRWNTLGGGGWRVGCMVREKLKMAVNSKGLQCRQSREWRVCQKASMCPECWLKIYCLDVFSKNFCHATLLLWIINELIICSPH